MLGLNKWQNKTSKLLPKSSNQKASAATKATAELADPLIKKDACGNGSRLKKKQINRTSKTMCTKQSKKAPTATGHDSRNKLNAHQTQCVQNNRNDANGDGA